MGNHRPERRDTGHNLQVPGQGGRSVNHGDSILPGGHSQRDYRLPLDERGRIPPKSAFAREARRASIVEKTNLLTNMAGALAVLVDQRSQQMPWGDTVPADFAGIGAVEAVAAHRAGLPSVADGNSAQPDIYPPPEVNSGEQTVQD